MIHILTSSSTILKVEVRPQESRIGDSNIKGVLSLMLKKTLTDESFAEQQGYLQSSATAAYISLNKLDQRSRFRASVNLKSCDNSTFNFTQGSSSSGLGYALACFQAWWIHNLAKKVSFNKPIFATGEVLTSGQINQIAHITEKAESICNYVEKNQNTISSFYFCYPDSNKDEISPSLKKRLLALGGELVSSNRLQQVLGELLGDYYDGDPLGRWLPFKGLKSFNYEDCVRFFGREIETKILLDNIKGNEDGLMISGDHSSGKTSLIQASLIPALEQEDKSISWSYTKTKQVELLDFIWESVSIAWDIPINEIREIDLNNSEEIAHLLNSKAEKSGRECFIFIDQLESIFSQSVQTHNLDLNIIKDLCKSIKQLKISICLDSAYLHHAIEKNILGTDNIIQVSSDIPSYAWRDILNKQALFSGITFEINEQGLSLDRVITEDALVIKQALPMVGHLMESLYKEAEKVGSTILKFEYYNKLGGLKGVITNLISTTISKDKENKSYLPLFLETFIDIDKSSNATLRKIEIHHPNVQVLKSLIDELMKAHLIMYDTHSHSTKTFYYLAHPFLLNTWPEIVNWKSKAKNYSLWLRKHEDKIIKWSSRNNEESTERTMKNEIANAFITGWKSYNRSVHDDKYMLSIRECFLGLTSTNELVISDVIEQYMKDSLFKIMKRVLRFTLFLTFITISISLWYFI